jgi:hypothetical protein
MCLLVFALRVVQGILLFLPVAIVVEQKAFALRCVQQRV